MNVVSRNGTSINLKNLATGGKSHGGVTFLGKKEFYTAKRDEFC